MRISDWSSDVCSSDLANFEHYYVQFITRSLMDLATIVAPMSRLMSGDLWRVAFDADLKSSIERGKRFVVFKPDVAEGEEAETDIGQGIGRASCRERVCQYV